LNIEYGTAYFTGQYQQDPINMTNAEISHKTFQYWKESDDQSRGGQQFKASNTIIAIDPAGEDRSGNGKTDNTAIVCVSQGSDNRIYIRDWSYGRWNTDNLIKELFRMQAKFKCSVKFETIGMQAKILEMVRKEMQLAGRFFSVIEVKSHGKGVTKNDRIRSTLIPYYENMRILHPKHMEGTYFEEELLRFPKAKHDDLIDSLEMAVSHFKLIDSEVVPDEEDFDGIDPIWDEMLEDVSEDRNTEFFN